MHPSFPTSNTHSRGPRSYSCLQINVAMLSVLVFVLVLLVSSDHRAAARLMITRQRKLQTLTGGKRCTVRFVTLKSVHMYIWCGIPLGVPYLRIRTLCQAEERVITTCQGFLNLHFPNLRCRLPIGALVARSWQLAPGVLRTCC